jgi:hypothetical protein
MRRSKIRPNEKKLRELILLISELSQNDPKFGAVKFNKLLFYCDFSAYLTHGTPITGQEYFALEQGPAPRQLVPITKKMKKSGELADQEILYFGHVQKRPIALRHANVSVFSSEQVSLIRQTIEDFRDKNATEISEQCHFFLGWRVAKNKETIQYSTALVGQRPPSPEESERGLKLQSLAEKHLAHARV